MSNEAPFDGVSKESLEAIGKVVQLCLEAYPCKRSTCKRCRKREEAWQNAMTQADEAFESEIWGELT